MSVTSEAHAPETHDALDLVSLPALGTRDAGVEASGSLQGIVTGVVAGSVIWFGVLLLFVF